MAIGTMNNDILREALQQVFDEQHLPYLQGEPWAEDPKLTGYVSTLFEIYRSPKKRPIRRAFLRAVWLVVMIFGVFCMTAMSIPSVRSAIIQTIETVFHFSGPAENRPAGSDDPRTEFYYPSAYGKPDEIRVVYAPTQLPEGFSSVRKNETATQVHQVWSAPGADASYIALTQYCYGSTFYVNLDGYDQYDTTVLGKKATLYLKPGTSQVIWSNGKYIFQLTISNIYLSAADVMELANSVAVVPEESSSAGSPSSESGTANDPAVRQSLTANILNDAPTVTN